MPHYQAKSIPYAIQACWCGSKARAPIEATVYELEKLTCNLCGEVFTAEAPEVVGTEKYDATAASMMALSAMAADFPGIGWRGWRGAWGPRCRPPRNARSS